MKLQYIHDPLCGWCYGAAPLIAAARQVLPVVAHGGGMMTGSRRQRVTPQLRSYVMTHDQRIAQVSGQPFGERYFEGLLRDVLCARRCRGVPGQCAALARVPAGAYRREAGCERHCRRRILRYRRLLRLTEEFP